MPATTPRDALRPSASAICEHPEPMDDSDPFNLNDFEEEMKRLSAANEALLADFDMDDAEDKRHDAPAHMPLSDADMLAMLRMENTELKARIRDLEAMLQDRSGQSEDVWLERQREYETLLEEKSEVIRSLHQKIQEAQESAIGGFNEPPPGAGCSSTRLGQAEEILRLKREMDDQRRQLQQDEEDMMEQLRQMEMTMARERAEMARQRQEINRLQADLAREVEHVSRDSGLRDRLQNLRRPQEPARQTPEPIAIEKVEAPAPEPTPQAPGRKSSSFFRRMFG